MNLTFLHSPFFSNRAKIFCVLCQTRNFSETAKIIGISQPAVSRNIALLEKELSITLVDRSVRPLVITSAGKTLFSLLMKPHQNLNRWQIDVQTQANVHMPLRFGTITSLAKHLNAPIIKTLGSQASTVISLGGMSVDLLKSFERGEIDFILSSEPFWDKTFYRRYLFGEPSVLVVPPNFQASGSVTWEQMRFCGLPRIAITPRSSNGKFEQSYFSGLGIDFVDKILIDEGRTFMEYIADGLGWGLQTPTFVALFPEHFEKIKVLPMPSPVQCREIYLLSRNEPDYIRVADKMTNICTQTLLQQTIPNLLKFAPWIAPYLTVAGDSGLKKKKVLETKA